MTRVTAPAGSAAYGPVMDSTDPILLVAAIAVVAAFLAPLASRLISGATAELGAELGSSRSDQDLSQIRRRR